MILGALIDAGVSLASLRGALGSLAIDPDVVWTERVTRAGLSATKFCVRGEDVPDHAHDHRDHEGGEHHHHPAHTHPHAPGASAQETVHHHDGPHRTIAEIYHLIDGSALSPRGKERAKGLFQRLGEAEAAVHGIPVERVHLHEVGALDSIIDIVGAVYGFEWFGITDIVASPLNVGGGTVRCAHGVFPVPAPATARLLAGTPIYGGGTMELVTPTGALLITGYAGAFGPLPTMRIDRVGYGAGDRDPKETPNVLRVMHGERAAQTADDAVVQIECEIDDMNPQLFGPLMDRLGEAGALDVFYAAVQMKKNRPGTLVTVVAPPEKREAITGVIFT